MLEDENRREGAIEELRALMKTRPDMNILTDAADTFLLTPNASELRDFLNLYYALEAGVPEKVSSPS